MDGLDANFEWTTKFDKGDVPWSLAVGTQEDAGGTVSQNIYPLIIDAESANDESAWTIVKLTDAGSEEWRQTIPVPKVDLYYPHLDVDNNETLFLSGHFEGAIDLDADGPILPIRGSG